MSEKNDIVLSYNDSIIYKSDLKLLDKNQWINDRIIGFWYEYLEQELFKENNKLSFINPSTVQYLKMCSSLDEAKACFLEPLDLLNKGYLFMPLNNNKIIENTFNDQGSHWSLLVINMNDSILTHYDSLPGGTNQTEAKLFFQKYKSYFRLNKFIEAANYPRQNNSSDCGIFVCGTSEFIAECVTKNISIDYNLMNLSILRERLKRIILNLVK